MNLQAHLAAKFPPPVMQNVPPNRSACVAAILRGTSVLDLEVGFIRRARQDQDRWSGQIAFPGGRAEPEDADSLATAIRETFEEIGLQLPPTALVGQLNDLQARKAGQLLDFYIRPYVFFHLDRFSPVLDPREVADFFWISLTDLRSDSRQIHFEFAQENLSLRLPAIQMPSEPPLWGLTYMMTQELLRKVL